MRQIFFDTETTGLDAVNGDRVVEIGCIEMIDRKLTGDNRHFYLNPERASHPDAARIHGLTEAFLSDKPKFADIADDLLSYLKGAELVIHNAPFDIGFMNAELARLKRGVVTDVVARVRDTLLLAREQYPGKGNSLDALCKRLEVDNSNRSFHGALLDAGLLAEVYIRMTRGQGSLVIEQGSQDASGVQIALVELSTFELSVVEPTLEEVAAHEQTLLEIDKASKGKTAWRRAVA
jgi:DNA polymerase III subunit epsilon